MRVPTLDKNMNPLMPTTPVRARLLMKKGKAKAYRNKLGIFCIILMRIVKPDNQRIALGVDPGSSYEGFSIVGTHNTVLNGMSEAVKHVKMAVKQRRAMRRARRHRNCRRRPARFKNRLRNKKTLPPSTFARWNAKLRIMKQMLKIVPISDVAVEDVKAHTKKGKNKWNLRFSPLEQGKNWLYNQIQSLNLNLHTIRGFDTKELRDKFGLKKTTQKSKKSFDSHAVDAWVMAASITGAKQPDEKGLYYWSPIRLHRRQLHYFQPSKGGIRKPYGGTRSYGLKRGTLVKHAKYGLTYVGGMQQKIKRITLHSIKSGKRATRSAKISDLKILTTIKWRIQFIQTLMDG